MGEIILPYIYMLCVFVWYTFFLEWGLFVNIKRIRLPGTEHMDKEYYQKWFHVKIYIPVIPFAAIGGFLSSALAMLLRQT